MTEITSLPGSLDLLIEKILNISSEKVLWLDKSGLIKNLSQAGQTFLGVKKSNWVGRSIFQFSHSFNRVNWQKTWNILKESKTLTLKIKLAFNSNDLSAVPVSLNYLYLDDGFEFCIVKFEENLSKQVSGELMLHQNKFIFENISDLIFWTDTQGRFQHVNRQSQKLLDLTDSEMGYLWDLFPNLEKEKWLNYFELARSKKNLVIEVNGIDKIKDNFCAEVSLYFQRFKGQEYFCGIVKDITQRKRKETQLRIALQEINNLKESLEAENDYLQDEINLKYAFPNIISASNKYQKILQEIEEVAPTNATVLILGETGTGKELFARAIHRFSRRKNRPLVKINCAALPETLIESELFGYERGAFTGAIKRKIGKFELANEGTIFLDEVGEMDFGLQAKLLRVLQEGEITRIGSNTEVKVDVRVIAATNKNLYHLVKEGKFREDLYYRLNVFPIENIPLRERKEDIPLLVQHFIRKYNNRIGKAVTNISKSDLQRLSSYHFPGNIRELENIVERGIILSRSSRLSIDFWNPDQGQEKHSHSFKSFEDIQRDHIISALKHAKGKVSGKNGAGQLLGLNPKTLESKMRKFGIKRHE